MDIDQEKLDQIDRLYASDEDKKDRKGKKKGGKKVVDKNGATIEPPNKSDEASTEQTDSGKKKKEALFDVEADGVDLIINESKYDELDAMYSDEDEKKPKKSKKKKTKTTIPAELPDTLETTDNGQASEPTVKTAAQKKKEKKEREKQKRLEEKSKQREADIKELTPSVASEHVKVDEAASGPPVDDTSMGASGTTAGTGDGKKKKKKSQKEEVKKEDPKEKARLKRVAMMKESLAKLKEEEERIQREEDEAERKREEFLREKEERERIDKERRDKKKIKAKERMLRLKEEGKLLTDKQKQDRRRIQELIEARGLDIETGDAAEEKKKKPRYEKLKRKGQHLVKQTSEEEAADENNKEPSPDDGEAAVTPDKAESSEAEDWEQLADDWEHQAEELEKEPLKLVTKEVSKVHVRVSEQNTFSDEEEESEEDDDEEESESEESEESEEEVDPLENGKERLRIFHEKCEAERTEDNLRAPVVCVLGHVDTGKTKILDKLRRTNVQDGEAGGITQQIGATNVPAENIREATRMCQSFQDKKLKLPGLLIIDTPGHESFSNLRSRGSSLCDLAILVVDIMHSLEPQTIESIKLLLERKTPFVVALNKIDRLYQWKSSPKTDVKETLKMQRKETYQEFDDRVKHIVADFAMQELNVKLFYENPDPNEYISMVPTSAHSGDGMGDLLSYLCEFAELFLSKRLSFSAELQATTMEVKEIHGLGTTIDVILVNGTLREGQTIVVAGQEGPIVTQIRGLLMPAPMKELRVKNSYDRCKMLKGAQGVKIIAKDLEKALAGLPLYASNHPNEILHFKTELSKGLAKILKGIAVTDHGVYVQASTLGSLEALLIFLRSQKIPYSAINIGPVHKRDIMKASVMLERDPKWAVILAFDVKVEREAQELADSLGVRIFTADIIYHLYDSLLGYIDDINKANREKYKDLAIFPVKLRILPNFIFNKRAPIVCGVTVEAGILREGTPICVPSKDCLDIGKVFSIELNHKTVTEAKKGQEVCIRIDPTGGDAPKMFGRHFDEKDLLTSKISRESIDTVKEYFREELSREDWKLMVELKKILSIS